MTDYTEVTGWRKQWYGACMISVGAVPLPIYLVLGGLIMGFTLAGAVPQEISMIASILVFFGATCSELGKRLPFFNQIGGGVILAIFLPSYFIFKGWLPKELVTNVQDFTNDSRFIYVYIATVIVGSILGMDRQTLIQGFLKIFIPIGLGSILAGLAGTAVGELLGIGWEKALFFIVIPIMAGGVGEGAIPLSIGYSSILERPQAEIFAEVIPVVFIGSLMAVCLSAMLAQLGKMKPHLSGDGSLTISGDDGIKGVKERAGLIFDPQLAVAGGLIAISLYLIGLLCHELFGLPAPVAMLFLAVLLKLVRGVPPKLEDGAYMVYKFFYVGVTYPLLFAIGLAMTPWENMVAVFNLPYMITIFVTVLTLVATGFFMAKWLKMYPVEAAIVNACHSGQGGTGDVAILTAADRMVLMPFAQISTRIGGAVTVTLAIIALAGMK